MATKTTGVAMSEAEGTMKAAYGVVEKNDSTAIGIYRKEFKGKDYLHIREFYVDRSDDQWHFGKGVALVPSSTDDIDKIIAALTAAKADF